MNAAARAAVRLGISRGFRMLGVRDGFVGLKAGAIEELGWGDVEGWTGDGGAHLGLRRTVPVVGDLYAISRVIEDHHIDALLVIGGWNAYQAAHLLYSERDRYPALSVPVVCVPATIDNNVPGSEIAIGADTALNTIVDVVDRVKMSAQAVTRCFVVETMGRRCGYLALMSGLAGGAEKVYLHEEGITLDQLNADVAWLKDAFAGGRKLVLAMRNEEANEHYTTEFIAGLFEEEGHGAYDVRTAVIGHQQQGASPTPFDRLLATRLVSHALGVLGDELAGGTAGGHFVGLVEARVLAQPMESMMGLMDLAVRRPKAQWWLGLRDVVRAVSVG